MATQQTTPTDPEPIPIWSTPSDMELNPEDHVTVAAFPLLRTNTVRKFFTEVYPNSKIFRDDKSMTALHLYPIAPMTTHWIGRNVNRTKQTYHSVRHGTRTATEEDVGNAVYAVSHLTDKETLMKYLQAVAKQENPATRPQKKLWQYAADFNLNAETVKEAIRTHRYTPVIKSNTENWLRLTHPNRYSQEEQHIDTIDPVEERCIFIDGEQLVAPTAEALRRMVFAHHYINSKPIAEKTTQ